MSPSLVAARGNTIFPVETYGDTLIVLPKGDKAGFGEADFRVECSRVAAALRDPLYRNLVLDFSLTNYVGGDVIEELQKWVSQVEEQGGRAVACEVSDDMRKGLELFRRGDDWFYFDNRSAALKAVAHETVKQKATRWAPAIATALAVAALVLFGAWVLTNPHKEKRHLAALEDIWKDYEALRRRNPEPSEWPKLTTPLVERLDQEVKSIRALGANKYVTSRYQVDLAERRMRPILKDPRVPDPREAGVEAALQYLRAWLDNASDASRDRLRQRYEDTAPAGSLAAEPSTDPVEGAPVDTEPVDAAPVDTEPVDANAGADNADGSATAEATSESGKRPNEDGDEEPAPVSEELEEAADSISTGSSSD